MNILACLIFIAAAILAIGGNLAVRRTLRGGSVSFAVAGFVLLACYGLTVNSFKWSFSSLMCVYIGFFALVHVLVRRFLLKEAISLSTWFGLTVILAGGLIVQFGQQQQAAVLAPVMAIRAEP